MATKQDKKAEVAVQEHLPYNPAVQTWEQLRGESHQILGYDLAKEEILDALERVPFIITKVISRPGAVHRDKDGNDKQYHYYTSECVIAPEEDLARKRIDMSTFPFRGGDHVVFNDGSTGIKRQITQYLQGVGYIELPDGPINGPFGVSILDLPPSDWTDVKVGELTFDDDGFANYVCDVRLFCPRGLRISEYASDFNPDGAKTRYLA